MKQYRVIVKETTTYIIDHFDARSKRGVRAQVKRFLKDPNADQTLSKLMTTSVLTIHKIREVKR